MINTLFIFLGRTSVYDSVPNHPILSLSVSKVDGVTSTAYLIDDQEMEILRAFLQAREDGAGDILVKQIKPVNNRTSYTDYDSFTLQFYKRGGQVYLDEIKENQQINNFLNEKGAYDLPVNVVFR